MSEIELNLQIKMYHPMVSHEYDNRTPIKSLWINVSIVLSLFNIWAAILATPKKML